MQTVKNPCNCQPPQRHQYCHCEGQCAKGDAYEKYVKYMRWLNEQRYLKGLQPARNNKVSPSKRQGGL
jgi:hypothetical protein